MPSFKEAFASARKAGKKEFTWNGKRYHTRLKEETKKSSSAPKTSPRPKARPKASPSRADRRGPKKTSTTPRLFSGGLRGDRKRRRK